MRINVKVATAGDFFRAVEREQNQGKIKLGSYSFDFMLYDENSNLMNHKTYRTVHRIDYWSGYYSNKGQHKALIKSAFHKWMVAQNFYELATLTRCSDSTSEDSDPASAVFYENVCSSTARSKYEQKM